MASNLITARSLIQADLDHARSVLELWTHQVEELEKALEQIDAVSNSRNALRVQYQGTTPRTPALDAPATSQEKPRRGRKPGSVNGGNKSTSAAAATGITSKRGRKLAERSTLANAQVSESKHGKSGKSGKAGAASKANGKRAAKYQDPQSGKTWSGLGRRPAWFVGAPEQFALNGASASPPNAAAQVTGDASPT